MKFRGLYIIFLLSLLPVLLLSQSGNPFEIKARKTIPAREIKKEKKADQSPKDTISIPYRNTQNQVITKSKVENTPGSIPDSVMIADSIEPAIVPSGDNPFDLSEERIVFSPGRTEVSNGSQPEQKVVVDTKTKKHINFIFWVILLSLIVLAFPLSIDRWYVVKIMRSLFNINISSSLARDFTGFNILLFALLYIVFLVSLSVFIFLLLRDFAGMEGTFLLYLLSLGGVLSVYLIRHVGLLITKWIFPEVAAFNAFNFTILSFNSILGIGLIIPNFFLAFSQPEFAKISFFAGIGIILIFYFMRTFRGLMISFKTFINHPIHFFIYLCTFEILPLLTLYKLALEFN
ncbi:MAG TPA: DUF4271 domain-containing protein [Saprospiraceae bacterium]|nr:DUF4271 domain-containing protein [Saprospiraceae bacterium]